MYPKYYSFNLLYNSYGHVPINDFTGNKIPKKPQIVFSGKPVKKKELRSYLDLNNFIK